jgi:hypothetical protein
MTFVAILRGAPTLRSKSHPFVRLDRRGGCGFAAFAHSDAAQYHATIVFRRIFGRSGCKRSVEREPMPFNAMSTCQTRGPEVYFSILYRAAKFQGHFGKKRNPRDERARQFPPRRPTRETRRLKRPQQTHGFAMRKRCRRQRAFGTNAPTSIRAAAVGSGTRMATTST